MNKADIYKLAKHPHFAELFIDELGVKPELAEHIACLIARDVDKKPFPSVSVKLIGLLDDVNHRLHDIQEIEVAA